jgi:hypothetical protein
MSGLVMTRSPGEADTRVARADSIAAHVPAILTLARDFSIDEDVWASVRIYRGRRMRAAPLTVTSTIVDLETRSDVWTARHVDTADASASDGVEHRLRLPLSELGTGRYRLRLVAESGDGGMSDARELDFRVS